MGMTREALPGSQHVQLPTRGTRPRGVFLPGSVQGHSWHLDSTIPGGPFQLGYSDAMERGKTPRIPPWCSAHPRLPDPTRNSPFLCLSIPGPGSEALPGVRVPGNAPGGGAEAPSWKSGWRPHFPGRAGSCCIPGWGQGGRIYLQEPLSLCLDGGSGWSQGFCKLGKAPGPGELP